MDLADLNAAPITGAVMELRHPGDNTILRQDNGDPITITLYGRDSPQYRSAERMAINQRLNSGRNAKASAESLEEDATKALIACTVAWSGMKFQGDLLECNAGNVKRVYESLPWVREQVDQFISDRANFLKRSPKG